MHTCMKSWRHTPPCAKPPILDRACLQQFPRALPSNFRSSFGKCGLWCLKMVGAMARLGDTDQRGKRRQMYGKHHLLVRGTPWHAHATCCPGVVSPISSVKRISAAAELAPGPGAGGACCSRNPAVHHSAESLGKTKAHLSLVAPYRAMLRYYRCDTLYRAMLFQGGLHSPKMVQYPPGT